ncbi:MAG: M20/M25/M40 family metallo-hydrolase [Alphaproteobacteria bacterium]
MNDGICFNDLIKSGYHKAPSFISQYHIDAVDLLKELIRYKSVTPDYSDAQKLLAEELSKLGFEVDIFECFDESTPENLKVYNLFAKLGDGRPSFLFCGHSDVVPTGSGWEFDPFGGEVIGDYVCGRGSEDMKSGIACFLAALSQFVNKHQDLKGQIAILISGAEENHSHNGVNSFAKYLKSRNISFDVCLTGEPTSTKVVGDTYKPGRRGNIDFSLKLNGDLNAFIPVVMNLCQTPLDNGELGFPPSDIVPVGIDFFHNITGKEEKEFVKLTITGSQGHSAYSYLALNPIGVFLNLLDEFEKYNINVEVAKVLSNFLAVNIIPPVAEVILAIEKNDYQKAYDNILSKAEHIEMFKTYNVEKDDEKAEIFVNFRFGAKWNFTTLKNEVETRIKTALNGFNAATENCYKGLADSYASKGDKTANLLAKILKDEFNLETKANFGGGTSDTRHLVREGVCIEAMDLGVLSQTMHKVNEKTSVEGIKKLAVIYEKLIENFFNVRS